LSQTFHEFEKQPGVSKVEVRHGFAQVDISHLQGDLAEARLKVLKLVYDAHISLDFLKLTQSGLAFIVPGDCASSVESALKTVEGEVSVHSTQSIVLVHAVNMRDEEGLIASIVNQVIMTGSTINHVGDMHDRLLLVVETSAADSIANKLRHSLMGGTE